MALVMRGLIPISIGSIRRRIVSDAERTRSLKGGLILYTVCETSLAAINIMRIDKQTNEWINFYMR